MDSHLKANRWWKRNLDAPPGLILALAWVVVLGVGGCKSQTGNRRDTGVGGSDAKATDGADAGQPDASLADRPADLPGVCSTDAGAKSKGKAEACTCDSECRTGFCVDGVCCATACTDTCKACNLPIALGECSLVPSGAKPSNPLQCPADRASTCGPDGTCDGAGACRKYVEGTECKPGSCSGDSVTGALTCDGKGSCSRSEVENCYPYTCDPTTNLCATECTTNLQCASGQSCLANSCGKKLNGSISKSAVECLSGHHADGVCCNIACSGPCVSCNQPGSVGRCKFVDHGLPDPVCPAQDVSTCGTTGLCDGAGSCALFPENTLCEAASCAGSVLLNTPRVCDGQGTCRSAELVDCSPYLCSSGDCNGSCTFDDECEPGHQCVAAMVRGMTTGRCGQKKNGQSCADPSDCESNQCVDGVCCESACAGPCRSCALSGSPGQCVNVASGAADPRQTCQDNGRASCGTNGVCDGTGACQKYAPGTVCGTEVCQAGAHTPAATCNQSGQCVTPPVLMCNPFTCNGSSCFGTCSTDTQCEAGNVCSNSSCGLKPLGAECSAAQECKSNHCAQGVCCNSECAGACLTCNLSGSLGLCNPVPDGAPDPQDVCKATLEASCGTTGTCKGGECAYFAKGLNCKPALCSTASAQTPPSICDGAGACVTLVDVSCGTYICSSTTCKSSCVSDADCTPPNSCINNSCGPKPLGTACTAGAQCVSGYCTEGVCCESVCSDDPVTGLCRSCKVPGASPGSCLPVTSGGADPKHRCSASNAAAGDCSNDGTCNGAGACRPWSTDTGCRGASCQAGALTLETKCDGKGTCPAAAAPISCAPYICSTPPTSCRTTCATVADCTSGEACLRGTDNLLHCGAKLPDGSACTGPTDCLNFCSPEGICCHTACTSACQTCALTRGQCTNIAVGQNPRDSTACTAAATGACGYSGNCDGTGNCELLTSCNDQNACTQTDRCNASNHCVGSNPKTCSASDQCHTAGTCDTSTGQCSNPIADNGTTCNDGNGCTQTDTCQAGVCTGSNPKTCTVLDQCHDVGVCDHSTGACSNPKKANGTTCNDGNANTAGDVCTDGVCAGVDHCVGATCTASDQCHDVGVCNNHATGACSNPAKPNTPPTSCNDGNPNTVGDVCTNGTCVGVDLCASVTCPDPDQCHDRGSCDHATGICSNPAKPNTPPTSCNDGNPNTVGDVCTNGNCAGVDPCASVTCPEPDQCHDPGSCDHATGICSNPAKAEGTPCSDGNACTQPDTCQSGACTPGNAVECTARDQCHLAGSCDSVSGCSNPVAPADTPCSDGNLCCQAEACTGPGICLP